jgi:hypothetical protein
MTTARTPRRRASRPPDHSAKLVHVAGEVLDILYAIEAGDFEMDPVEAGLLYFLGSALKEAAPGHGVRPELIDDINEFLKDRDR